LQCECWLLWCCLVAGSYELSELCVSRCIVCWYESGAIGCQVQLQSAVVSDCVVVDCDEFSQRSQLLIRSPEPPVVLLQRRVALGWTEDERIRIASVIAQTSRPRRIRCTARLSPDPPHAAVRHTTVAANTITDASIEDGSVRLILTKQRLQSRQLIAAIPACTQPSMEDRKDEVELVQRSAAL
jgi:hypothetical protein